MPTIVYTVEEVATLLNTTVRTVRSSIKSGKIPAIKIGKEYRIMKTELDRVLQSRNDTREREKL